MKIKENPKFLYKLVRKRSKIKSTVGPLLNENEKLTDDDQEMANILKNEFVKSFSKPKHADFEEKTFYDKISDENFLQEIEVTEEKIMEAIKEMPKNTSSGPDSWPAELLKKCKSELAKPLQIICEKSLKQGEIPKELLKANITPIFKKGEKHKSVNYRPISLTSLISKIIERVIRKSIIDHLELNKLINKNQHGFRKRRSTLTQLLDHYDNILNALEHNEDYDVIYTDFKKAFDKCEFNIICEKLLKYKIGGDIGRWIKNFLMNRTFKVVVNGTFSETEQVTSSVPQGTVLAPLLFLLMINDIDENIKSCKIESFADDTKISRNITRNHMKRNEDQKCLQQGIDEIFNWSEENNMEFNNKKFYHVRYSNKASDISNSYKINDMTIKTVSEIKDLGIIMSNDMRFKTEIEKSVNKARQKMGLILRTFRTRDQNIMLMLYKAIIRPHLEYGTILAYPTTIKESSRMEGVQRTFTSKIPSLQQYNYWNRLKKLKIFSLDRRRERFTIIYVWKIIENLTENLSINKIETYTNTRKGRLCKIPPITSKTSKRLKSIKRNSFAVRGPILFNCIPGELRNITKVSVDIFKIALDKWIVQIPDKPTVDGYVNMRSENSNSILEYVKNPKDWSNSIP